MYALFSATAAQAYCPPPGPLLPPPTIFSNSSKFSISDSVFENLPWASDTSYAIKASIGHTTVFEHEYSAPGREVGQSLLETQLRVGSVTKTFTMLAILLSADQIKLSDPITKFIPELDEVAYGDVTIAALASHTSGMGRYIYTGDLAIVPGFKPATLGLPSINGTGDKVSTCDPFPGGRVCTREEVVAGLNNPAYHPRSPDSGPLYSNIGYNLLGMALEAAHNKTSEQVIHDLIVKPLGMSKTSFSVPTNSSTALLPRTSADAGWFVPDLGNYNPSGGLWSTANDLLTFLQSILSHKLLNKPETRRWLQPRALLPSLNQAVGESWEILRPADLDVKTQRPIDIFTKTGGVTGYAAYTAIIREYGIALTINVAGAHANEAISALFPLLMKPLVAYADNLARKQAAVEYEGTYEATVGNMTNSMTLVVDDGPGIAVVNLTMNGVPVLQSLAAVQKIPFESFSARLYPTDPDSLGTEKEAWRILIDNKDRQRGFAELQCASWNWGDPFRYVTEPLDTIVFTKGADGIVSAELLGWRKQLSKT
ncbi:uncharacterized protein EKO05_0003827 [Ascochyta rabiei]|nr:uncharacterized protein EKO05_0003827 [Ascochyta rabiei]UPX13311.1 hypothetical protein EKO05_0003827 [Ascochyta rabiei]